MARSPRLTEVRLSEDPWLGVVGGMGPAAATDFMRRLTERTPAERDQDHHRVLLYGDPTTPDRSEALMGRGSSPLPKLTAGVRFLAAAGVVAIAIPCNSAHAWHEELQAEVSVPLLHIADAAVSVVRGVSPAPTAVGVLGTEGTLKLGFYQERLVAAGFDAIVPEAPEDRDLVMRAIRGVKAGSVDEAAELLAMALSRLQIRGAEVTIVGCTDLSVALEASKPAIEAGVVDASEALAAAAIQALS